MCRGARDRPLSRGAMAINRRSATALSAFVTAVVLGMFVAGLLGLDARAGRRVGFTSRVADRREPALKWRGELTYPEAARQEGVEGTVKLKVLVTETGKVGQVQVIQSSGDRRLDRAAAEWVKTWRYLPAVQNGQPRKIHTRATVKFDLQ